MQSTWNSFRRGFLLAGVSLVAFSILLQNSVELHILIGALKISFKAR